MRHAIGSRTTTRRAWLLALALVAGCGGSGNAGDASTSSAATTVPADVAPAITAPEATVPVAATAPTVPAPPELVLRKSGIGAFEFGGASSEAIDGITAQLGVPVSDEVGLYPILTGDGLFESAEFYVFRFPVGRTVCWLASFCVYFGGEAEDLMSFVGWSYFDPGATLQSIEGVTIGSRWSEFADMVAFPICNIEGAGTINGIELRLHSEGHIWLTDDFETVLPDPLVTTVSFMEAGEGPIYSDGGDC